jgi:hypothetical protein
MADAEDGRQGLTEDELVDDAVMDTLIRESVSQTIGDNMFAQARKPVQTAVGLALRGSDARACARLGCQLGCQPLATSTC